MSIYDYAFKTRKGEEVSMADYKGKVLIIVNTATGCGFTPQYKDLQVIYDKYKEKGLEILDFPCNQFANQAPGTDEEIHEFCTGRFGITFPQFKKLEVLGENADPLFRYLAENTRFEGFGEGPMAEILKKVVSQMDPDYESNGNIKWNFTKFLFDREGNLVRRFEPTCPVAEVRKESEALL